MSQVQRFEDLIAWQKARSLTQAVYRLTRRPEFARDRGLTEQIRRAAVSIMSNIAEGYERNSKPDFHRFLCIAKASCAEVRSQLYVALDAGYIPNEDFKYMLGLSEEVSRIIGGLRVSVERQMQSQKG